MLHTSRMVCTDYKNHCDMRKVDLRDIILDVDRDRAQEDDSDFCFAYVLINSFLRMPNVEQFGRVLQLLLDFREKENEDDEIDSEGFIYTMSG